MTGDTAYVNKAIYICIPLGMLTMDQCIDGQSMHILTLLANEGNFPAFN